jgi:hypothetical protein
MEWKKEGRKKNAEREREGEGSNECEKEKRRKEGRTHGKENKLNCRRRKERKK